MNATRRWSEAPAAKHCHWQEDNQHELHQRGHEDCVALNAKHRGMKGSLTATTFTSSGTEHEHSNTTKWT